MSYIELLAEILGWGSVFFLVLSGQRKSGKSIVVTQGIGNALCTLHYALGGVIFGALITAIATGRGALGATLKNKKLVYAMILCTVAPFIMIYLTSNNPIGYLGALGAGIVSMGVIFKDTNVLLVRVSNFSATIIWLIFAIAVGSLPMTISNIITLTSIIMGAVRHEGVFIPIREWLYTKCRPIAYRRA